MYRRIVEMGENFTGVKNQKLTRLAVGLAAVVVVVAAELALVQPRELTAQLAGKGARPAMFMVGPNVLYRSKHIPGSVYAGPGQSEAGLALLKAEAGKLPRDRANYRATGRWWSIAGAARGTGARTSSRRWICSSRWASPTPRRCIWGRDSRRTGWIKGMPRRRRSSESSDNDSVNCEYNIAQKYVLGHSIIASDGP